MYIPYGVNSNLWEEIVSSWLEPMMFVTLNIMETLTHTNPVSDLSGATMWLNYETFE